MAKYPGLYERGNVYWHRVIVPKDLCDAYLRKIGKPREDIAVTLGTTDRAVAVSKAKLREANFDRAFDEERRAIIIFMLPATYYFNAFWKAAPVDFATQLIDFTNPPSVVIAKFVPICRDL